MNKTIVFTVGILSIALFIGYYFYQQTNRYYITGAGKGVAYEVDKKTGQTWLLIRNIKATMSDFDSTQRPPKDLLGFVPLENKDTGTTSENNISKK